MTGLEIAFLIVSIIMSAYSIYLAATIRPPGINAENFDKSSVATPKEGDSLPVVFGTKRIKDANIVYYGRLRHTSIKKKGGKK